MCGGRTVRGGLVVLLVLAALAGGCRWPKGGSGTTDLKNGEETGAGGLPRRKSLPVIYTGEALKDLRQHTDTEVGADYDVDVSPDGRYMVFTSTRHREQPDIYMKEVDGRAVTRLTNTTEAEMNPQFSPDGEMIAYASNREGNWNIHVMKVGGGASMQVTRGAGDELHPSWSPDGKKLCYCAISPASDHWEIWTIDLDRSAPTMVTRGLFPEWSPKGDLIAFQRAREIKGQWYSIWTVRPDGTRETEIVRAGKESAAINPAWDPHGEWIVYATVHHSIESKDLRRIDRADDLWMVPVDGVGPVRLTTHPEADWNPNWTNGRIYFSSTRSGYKNIWSFIPVDFSALD